MDNKLAVVLAGPGREMVLYSMLPAFNNDREQRFTVLSSVFNPDALQTTVTNMQPDVLIIHGALATVEAIQACIKLMQQWNGTTIIVLPEVMRSSIGALQMANTNVITSDQINWMELAGLAYSTAQTNRARVASAAPAQYQATQVLSGAGMAPSVITTGTKRIAVVTQAGGAGASTVAEGLAYELAVRMSVRATLFSLGMPPAAVAHLNGIRYHTGLTDYFSRPSKEAFRNAIQTAERLDVIVAPESSRDYHSIAMKSGNDPHAADSIFAMLRDSDDGQHGAMIMDLPSSENAWMIHPLIFANTILVVTCLNVSDLFATRHLISTLASDPQIQRDQVYLVVNQTNETNTLTARQFTEELANNVGYAPQVCAIIEHDPAVIAAQNRRQPAVLQSEKLARGIKQISSMLFPGVSASNPSASLSGERSRLKLPRFKLG